MALITGLAAGTMGLLTILAVPQYATSVTFFVTTPSQGLSDAYQGGLFSAQRVTSYATLLEGDRLAQAIAADASLGLSPRQVQERITARVVPDTVLLEATVTDSSKARSKALAEALAADFRTLVQVLETPPGQSTATVKVDVVAGPTPDDAPVSPKPVRNLGLATLLGLLLGAGAAVLREKLDSTVKSAEELRDATDAPTLAVVPFDAKAADAPLLTEAASCSRSESLRHLRTNLQFADVDGPVRTLVVTSAVPGEGKSTTAVNTAITFAQADKRVLLIDADLRRPKVAEYLDLEGAVGLSNVLAGQVGIEDVVQHWGRHQLFVLPSGSVPPNPSELLGSRAMAHLLARQREHYDLIVIDTPPLVPVTDAAVLTAMADGAVMVARSGKTSTAQIRTGLARLRAVDARVLGCVLNMQATKASDGYYAYYGQQHDGKHRTRQRDAADLVRAA
ncbi:polysaccharide biosynthesis tyrosine autokinase [Phytohabitans houttuyneae]|uniref:non-specific protein-tyrosine kinase n=1 Tax=Phytohabitans houttuyneae TaxID=1076126 RepID=A0A6V8KDX4_9ACTN|nr:polysaccharide biosynthesis tyrosine autokinase [Phytohabitans houttuyneae]GFJ81630.1 chromosome partitioning protein [Phytohabitans houttuyneae]